MESKLLHEGERYGCWEVLYYLPTLPGARLTHLAVRCVTCGAGRPIKNTALTGPRPPACDKCAPPQSKYPPIQLGDKFDQLTVVGWKQVPSCRGKLTEKVVCKCGCKRGPLVFASPAQLYRGESYACRKCRGKKKQTRSLEVNGVSRTIYEWAELTGVPAYLIQGRIERGWSPEEAISLTSGRNCKRYE